MFSFIKPSVSHLGKDPRATTIPDKERASTPAFSRKTDLSEATRTPGSKDVTGGAAPSPQRAQWVALSELGAGALEVWAHHAPGGHAVSAPDLSGLHGVAPVSEPIWIVNKSPEGGLCISSPASPAQSPAFTVSPTPKGGVFLLDGKPLSDISAFRDLQVANRLARCLEQNG